MEEVVCDEFGEALPVAFGTERRIYRFNRLSTPIEFEDR